MLACKKCESRDTFTCRAKELADKTSNPAVVGATCGFVADPVSLALIVGAVRAVAEAARAAFEWLTQRERTNSVVVVCKGCGYWERVTAEPTAAADPALKAGRGS
jgi:hypothetical protein